ncbi:hypothetical protein GCM10023206_31500 [Acinetobacter puyangensis]|uniref:Uncharacterized protein n=1 Tax=Acinetobacter puyangensis TaxID=1096779 RepID=A0A240E2T5_9GAMM|nr:DUF6587 family protein [Acinetobacter puyangensis]SNX43084.1 hypothetical protein SAMN05421731_101118 [Acinetobacter puyangensis]
MIQYLIIAVLLLWSSVVVFKKVMPNTANKTFLAISMFFKQQGWHGLSKRFAPKQSSGCGGGCGCGNESDSASKHSQEIKTVKWK